MRKVRAPLTIFMGLIFITAIACSGASTPPPPAPQVQSPPPPPAAQAPAPPAPSQPSQPSTGGSGGSGGSAFTVKLEDPAGSGAYAFDPSTMTFKVGDTIDFTLTAEDEFHTFTVDDLGIDVELNGGETSTLAYTFDKAGTFKLICIPHEALGMTGTITVQ